MSVALENLDHGDTFVNGKDPQTARDLLAAADALGHDAGVVRTVQGGFVVPDDVWDHVARDYASASHGTTTGEF